MVGLDSRRNDKFKIEVVCDKNKKVEAEIYKNKNGKLEILINLLSFKPQSYNEIILNIKGNEMNLTTEPVKLVQSKTNGFVYEVQNLKTINNNKRKHKRVDVFEKAVLEQFGLEYEVAVHNISLGGAKITLTKEITIIGIFNLKIKLLEDYKFSLPATIVSAYADDKNQNIHVHLKFMDLSDDEEMKLAKCINELQLIELRRLRGK